MKNSIAILTLLMTVCSLAAYSQSVDGKITVNKSSRASLESDGYTVNLFKAFKEGENQIIFFFEGDGYEKESDEKPDYTFFTFRTIVKHNGKTIRTLEREPMPYIPGGMFLPAEAFDFIPILSAYQQESMDYRENTGKLPGGEYEIILEAEPEAARGEVTRGLIMFNVD